MLLEEAKLPVKALNLAGLVKYEVDSIVSRTVIDKTAGTVTLFAFAAGQGLSEHTAPYDALVYIADGAAEVTVAGNKITVKQGEMVVLPAHQPHALRAAEPFKMMLVMVKA